MWSFFRWRQANFGLGKRNAKYFKENAKDGKEEGHSNVLFFSEKVGS